MSISTQMAKAAGCSAQQVRVITLLGDGFSLSQISRIMEIHDSTVRTHRDRAYQQIRQYVERTTSDDGVAA